MGTKGSKSSRLQTKKGDKDMKKGKTNNGKTPINMLSPEERAEQRFLRSYNPSADEAASEFADIDQTVDRYDYLIAFPNPTKAKRSGGMDSNKPATSGRAQLRIRSRGRRKRNTTTGEQQSYQASSRMSEDEEREEEENQGLISCSTASKPKRRSSMISGGGIGESRINKHEILEIWYGAVPGDEVAKNAAQERLRHNFDNQFRTNNNAMPGSEHENVSIPFTDWQHFAREAIINTLYTSGLQMKMTLSKNQKFVLCRLRAPATLIEEQAARENMRLQFRGEIDPGYDFWTEGEIAEEQRLIPTKDKANELLEQLYQAGKISPNDLAVFNEEPTAKHWSRRIHALERIADKIPVTNRFPAYTEFDLSPKNRHLFQTYIGIRGKMLFKVKERLVLTKSIISTYFDLGVLKAKGVVATSTALHDANHGEKITKQVLRKRWVDFWRAESDCIGAPMVSMETMDEGLQAMWYMRPWCQPLGEVRDYFGEKLALYFAWLGFYSWSLVLPAFVCLGVEIYIYTGNESTTFMIGRWDPIQVGTVIFIIMWGSLYKQLWDREEKAIAMKWGTRGFVDTEKDRPQFKGDPKSQGGGRRRDPVTNTYQTYYPDSKRRWAQGFGILVIVFFIFLLLALLYMTEWLEHYLTDIKGYSWGGKLGSLISSIQIQLLSKFYKKVAVDINNWENYRTETDYEYNLVLKTFLFQMFNNYSALFFQSFVLQYTFGCNGENGSCIGEVCELLVTIFIVRFAAAGLEDLIPRIKRWMRGREEERMDKEFQSTSANYEDAGGSDVETGKGLRLKSGGGFAAPADREEEPFEAELLLSEYEGTFDDYAAIVLQYGYISMFVGALPLVVPLAMLETLLQIRVDAVKLLDSHRRPDPEIAESVGMWNYLMEAVGLLAIFTNTATICFTGNTLDGYSWPNKLLTWLVMEHGILAMKSLIHFLIPDMTSYLATIEARQKFIVQKHKLGFVRDEEVDEQGRTAAKKAHQASGNVDIVDLNYDENGAKKLGKADKDKLGKLRAEMREASRTLRLAKEQLQVAYANESFNEQTGIGETKHGLPLGCLNIKLIRLEGFEAEPGNTVIILSLRSTQAGNVQNPGPAPQVSRPAEPTRTDLDDTMEESGSRARAMEFNQLFVMAPIRTQDAELIFDITRDRRLGRQSRLGSCKVGLRELSDQLEKDLPLVIQKKNASGQWEHTKAHLYVKLKFMYSKILPLRNKIYRIKDCIRSLERDIMSIQYAAPKGS